MKKVIVFIIVSSLLLSSCKAVDLVSNKIDEKKSESLQKDSDLEKFKSDNDELSEKNEELQKEVDVLKEDLEKADKSAKEKETELESLKKSNEEIQKELDKLKENEENKVIVEEALAVLKTLKSEDYEALSKHVGGSGLNCIPYYFSPAPSVSLTQEQIADIGNSEDVLEWGVSDGIGDPIELIPSDYFEEYVYNQDFINAPIISVNQSLSGFDTANTNMNMYNDPEYVEFYFDSFEKQYEGMDWESLVLIFEKEDGQYKLVGVVHGCWQI